MGWAGSRTLEETGGTAAGAIVFCESGLLVTSSGLGFYLVSLALV